MMNLNETIQIQNHRFFGCSMYKKIPPATETLSDSYSPAIAMLTSSQACRGFSERPLPSLPKTKHNGVSDKESHKVGEREHTGFSNSPSSGCPASNFIWNSSLRDSTWFQQPETTGIWKEAPRLARRAFSLNGSQQPGRRKTPSCHMQTCQVWIKIKKGILLVIFKYESNYVEISRKIVTQILEKFFLIVESLSLTKDKTSLQ